MVVNRKTNQLRVEPIIAVAFLLAWILGVTLHYLYHDERFHLLHFLLRSLTNIVLLFTLVLAAFCAGETVWRSLRMNFRNCLETFVFSTALGFGIISYLMLVLGTFRLLYRVSCYFLLFGIIAVSIPRIRSFMIRLREERKKEAKELPLQDLGSPFITALKVIFIISICLYLIQVFTPPVNYDTLAYHLAIPKIYARNHQISYIPHNVYANFPMTMEFLYLLGLLLRGDTLAKLTHFSMGILTALAIYSFSMRYFNRKIALLGSLIFYNIPFVGLLSGWAFNDLTLTLYEFLAVAAIINWFSSGEEKWLPASAIFCGLSIGTKYPAFLLLLPFLLLAIVIKLLPLTPPLIKGAGKKIALFVLVVLLVASPWFIKNIFYTHNPVYPFLYGLFNKHFGHPGGETLDIQRFMKHHSPHDLNLKRMGPLLWKINMDKLMGPALILFLPLLIFIRSVKLQIKALLLFGLLYFLLWAFFTHQDIRFLIPCLPGLCIASAYAINSFTQRSKPLTLWMHTAILFVILFNLSWTPLTIAKYDLLKAAVGIETRDEFLMTSPLYQYSAFLYINNEVPDDAKILFIGENQTYYCDREVVSNSPLDTNIIVEIVNVSSSEEEIYEKLNSLGITHILYNASEIKRVAENYGSFNWSGEKAKELFFDFLTPGEYLNEIFSQGGVFLAELKK